MKFYQLLSIGFVVTLTNGANSMKWSDRILECPIELGQDVFNKKDIMFDECQGEGACCNYNH